MKNTSRVICTRRVFETFSRVHNQTPKWKIISFGE